MAFVFCLFTFVDMEARNYSFIIPVYNRPDEIQELLESFTNLEGNFKFEIVIVEDGSSETSQNVVDAFANRLDIAYFFKLNSGPGSSRNYGMQRAKGNYFIILDSDVLMPPEYLIEVEDSLSLKYVDCYGGPDAAHASFTSLQKAINFAMTSVISTGGIRGGKQAQDTFQPRSFNMGLSKKAFEASGGFGHIHPGEDPDLSIRLLNLGFETKLILKAVVFHKRRISWFKFYIQVNKFGMVRPILNSWHPNTSKVTYWFPSLFCLGFILALLLSFFNQYVLLWFYGFYFSIAFIMALASTKSLLIALQSILAIGVQFVGYGVGFLKSTVMIKVLKKDAEKTFPKLFFKHV